MVRQGKSTKGEAREREGRNRFGLDRQGLREGKVWKQGTRAKEEEKE
jgi:hypothetical protein